MDKLECLRGFDGKRYLVFKDEDAAWNYYDSRLAKKYMNVIWWRLCCFGGYYNAIECVDPYSK